MKLLLTIFLFVLFVAPASPQSPKPKNASEKPKPTATSQKKPTAAQKKPAVAAKTPGEKAEWEKAIVIEDPDERIEALRKFAELFPRSAKNVEAFTLIATIEAGFGNDELAAGDFEAAADRFEAAAKDAPKPVPEDLFTKVLSKIPAELYFRGLREAGVRIAKILEERSDANASQLLSIATFYISTENGFEAKRVAENAIKIAPDSAAAYQTLGLASRVDFQLEESAAAYAKALELEPNSVQARGGLAEMDRALGKADDAILLYREILASDEVNGPARTGLILALFDAGKREEAEAEMAASLEARPGNVILLASAAYWYAAHNEGTKAVDLARKALELDQRFIWSHIALARGYMVQKKPLDAERTLLIARRYGNFPTLDYEIASARLSAGLYREAAEELSKNFSIEDGAVHSNLGGRVSRETKSFTELVGYERRASIFAPVAAEEPESSAQLKALLKFRQELNSPVANSDTLAKAADEFVQGDDAMKVHRQIFVASTLLDKKTALPKALEIVRSAPQSLDAGLGVADPAAAVLASELYESRSIAAERGEYVNVPNLPRLTLSAILRGRIEEITGWTLYQMDDPAQASVHLRRASMVLPANSAWWRVSTWQLGSSLMLEGKEAEALDIYVKSYKGGTPDPLRYGMILALYKRVNGNTLGLEDRIGPDPSATRPENVAQQNEPKLPAELKSGPPAIVPVDNESTVAVAATSRPTPGAVVESQSTPAEMPVDTPSDLPINLPDIDLTTPNSETTPLAIQPDADPSPSPDPELDPTTDSKSEIQKSLEEKPEENSFEPTPEVLAENIPVDVPAVTPETNSDEPKPEPTPMATPQSADSSPSPELKPDPGPESTAQIQIPAEEKPKENSVVPKSSGSIKELFPPVIINIPSANVVKRVPPAAAKGSEPVPTPADNKPVDEPDPATSTLPAEIKPGTDTIPLASPTPEPIAEKTKTKDAALSETRVRDIAASGEGRPRIVENKAGEGVAAETCIVSVSEEDITIRSGGGGLAVIVGRTDDQDLDGLTAISTSPQNVSVRREVIEGVKTRAIFVVRSISAKPGIYQVSFVLPCGIKEIVVRVR